MNLYVELSTLNRKIELLRKQYCGVFTSLQDNFILNQNEADQQASFRISTDGIIKGKLLVGNVVDDTTSSFQVGGFSKFYNNVFIDDSSIFSPSYSSSADNTIVFTDWDLVEYARFSDQGNFLIGIDTDNGHRVQVAGNQSISGKLVIGPEMTEMSAGSVQINGTSGIILSDATAGNYTHSIYPTFYRLNIEGNSSVRLKNKMGGIMSIGEAASWTNTFFVDDVGFYSTSLTAGLYAGHSGGAFGFYSVGTSAVYYKALQAIYTSSTEQQLVFNSMKAGSNTESMRLTSNGNLLLGTTTDDTINKFQIAGGILISQNGRLKFRNEDNYFIQDSGFFQWYSADSTIRIRQDAQQPVVITLVGSTSYFDVNNGAFSLLKVERDALRTTIYHSFNLAENFTPTSTADTSGIEGDIAFDDNYMYRKTSTGWKRTALSTF